MTELSSVRLVTYSRRSWFSVQKEWLTLEAGVVFLSNPFHSFISPIDLWLKISRLLNRNLPMAESDILHIVVTQHYRAPEAQFPSHIVHIPPFYHLKSRRRWNSETWACACGFDKSPSIRTNDFIKIFRNHVHFNSADMVTSSSWQSFSFLFPFCVGLDNLSRVMPKAPHLPMLTESIFMYQVWQ